MMLAKISRAVKDIHAYGNQEGTWTYQIGILKMYPRFVLLYGILTLRRGQHVRNVADAAPRAIQPAQNCTVCKPLQHKMPGQNAAQEQHNFCLHNS